LGIIGLLSYIIFFIINYLNIIKISDTRIKIGLISLFYGIMANIVFNEVALSPNSCAGYFILLGLFLGKRDQWTNEDSAS